MKNHGKSLNRWLLCAGVLVLPAAASGQSDADIVAAGRGCLQIARERDRLDCFEQAFGTPSDGAAAAAPARAAPAAAPPPAAARAPVAAQAPVATPAAARAPTPTAASEPNATESTVRTVNIVDVRELRPGDFRFQTDAGELYYYSGSRTRRPRMPDVPFTATIEPGALGSRFLRFGDESSQRVRITDRN